MNRKNILHCLQVNFQNWHGNEPNIRNNMEPCAEMSVYHQQLHWSNVHCEKKNNNWLCQIRAGKIQAVDFLDLKKLFRCGN